MKLYYAMGGGLGHLTRGKALINTLGLLPKDFIVVTNSDYADKVFPDSKIEKLALDLYHKPEELKNKIIKLIHDYRIKQFFVDTFPMGMVGELSEIDEQNCLFYYVARFLKWDVYIRELKTKPVIFEKTFVVEHLGIFQMEFIKKFSKKHEFLNNLQYPSNAKPDEIKNILNQFETMPWLIAHSGPFNEVECLYNYALDIAGIKNLNPPFLILTQIKEKLPANTIHQLDYYPASDFYKFCPFIFTACGFNSMKELTGFESKHYFIPFERRYDDQFWRAREKKSRQTGILS
jgi:hypothetical protein